MNRKPILALALCLLFASPALQAEKPDDTRALKGIETGKVIWDVTVGNPGKLSMLLDVIDETYNDLVRQGVTPDMVFTFHGPSLKLISNDTDDIPLEEEADYVNVVGKLKDMLEKPGVRMESCSIAARLLGVDTSSILAGIEPVGNTFVSQIGYQAKGYAYIPVN